MIQAKINFKTADTINCTDPSKALHKLNLIVNVYLMAESLYTTLGQFNPQPIEDYENWIKTRIFCNDTINNNITGFVLDNHTPFLTLQVTKRTDICSNKH